MKNNKNEKQINEFNFEKQQIYSFKEPIFIKNNKEYLFSNETPIKKMEFFKNDDVRKTGFVLYQPFFIITFAGGELDNKQAIYYLKERLWNGETQIYTTLCGEEDNDQIYENIQIFDHYILAQANYEKTLKPYDFIDFEDMNEAFSIVVDYYKNSKNLVGYTEKIDDKDTMNNSITFTLRKYYEYNFSDLDYVQKVFSHIEYFKFNNDEKEEYIKLYNRLENIENIAKGLGGIKMLHFIVSEKEYFSIRNKKDYTIPFIGSYANYDICDLNVYNNIIKTSLKNSKNICYSLETKEEIFDGNIITNLKEEKDNYKVVTDYGDIYLYKKNNLFTYTKELPREFNGIEYSEIKEFDDYIEIKEKKTGIYYSFKKDQITPLFNGEGYWEKKETNEYIEILTTYKNDDGIYFKRRYFMDKENTYFNGSLYNEIINTEFGYALYDGIYYLGFTKEGTVIFDDYWYEDYEYIKDKEIYNVTLAGTYYRTNMIFDKDMITYISGGNKY